VVGVKTLILDGDGDAWQPFPHLRQRHGERPLRISGKAHMKQPPLRVEEGGGDFLMKDLL
jgi:hypothetical protein